MSMTYPGDQLKYRTEPEVRNVICDECPKIWRYGCKECADDFAKYHGNAFNHQVVVVPPPPRQRRSSRPRHRRNWWER